MQLLHPVRLAIALVLLVGFLPPLASSADPFHEIQPTDYQRRAIYHSPQTPGYTCWVHAWLMPDSCIMVAFFQATGPIEGRPRAPEDIQKKLSWPHLANPKRDMTGLNLCNVYLRSKDGGATWEKVSEDSFRSPMNGAVVGTTGLRNGNILRAVFGAYLAYDPNVPKTGLFQRSDDGTKSWSGLQPLLDPSKFTVYPARLRQLRDGRVAVIGGMAKMPCDRAWAEYGQILEPLFMLSGDGGKTWDPPIPVIPEENRKGWACEECDAAELPNGDLLWVFRRCDPKDQDRPLNQRRHVRWQGLMVKDGKTWKPKSVGPAPFPHSGLPDLLVTREGVVLHVTEPGIHWTADAGQNWHNLGLPRMAYYPKSLQLADGRVLVFGHLGSDDPYGVDQAIVMDSFRLKVR
jgi:hypothetical protein